ncbi:MAG: hypothetical protein R6U41_08325 [Desulfosalsimonas sp.]|uniref:hypothetical protein n=1 Tax=Desulfosalsimonas sp. TaxID=3073848 RepID=UPI0039708C14
MISYQSLTRYFVCISLFLLLLALPAAGFAQDEENGSKSGEKLRQDAMEFMESLKQYSAEKQQEAAEKFQSEFDEMDERLEKMERRFEEEKSEMSREMREKMKSNLEELRRQREEMAAWLEKFESGSKDAWDHLREGLSKSFRDFSRSLEKTDEQMESTEI